MIVWALLWCLPPLAIVAGLRATRSRRLLGISLAFAIPFFGPVLALLAARVRGAGTAARPAPDATDERLPEGADAVRAVAALPPVLDRALSADGGERLSALVALSRRADAEAVSILRWVVEHGNNVSALDAALALEELELRFEHRARSRR